MITQLALGKTPVWSPPSGKTTFLVTQLQVKHLLVAMCCNNLYVVAVAVVVIAAVVAVVAVVVVAVVVVSFNV